MLEEKAVATNALAELLTRAGQQFARREAVVSGDRSMTFAEVEADSNRLASYLSVAAGLKKGERVAILLPNCPEFVVADFALIKAGLIRVPVNPRYTAHEIEFIMSHSAAAVLVTSAAFAGVVAEIRPALASLRVVISVNSMSGVPGEVGWRDALDRGAPTAFALDTADDDGYMLAYTSGTTGRPKGAFTTIKARWAGIFITYANELFVTPSDAMLHVASLAHGSGTKVLPVFVKGGSNVLMPKFSPIEFFRLVEEHEVTISWMVPTMVAMLVDAWDENRFDTSSLRTVIYGGAPMPQPVLQRALATFGPIFVQIYGLTEAPHPDLILAKHEHLPDPITGQRSGRGATGRAAVGVRIRLVDDTGRDVAAGEVGEIIVGGDHIMAGYWNDPGATADTVREGWCYTGDLARVDEQGFYTIVDRKKEMIISGGYNVYPREVEDVLYRHPSVAECAVIGVPDGLWGETVHALIVTKPDCETTAEEIGAHCARELAGYKKPRKVTLLPELPKTANGKIDKKALRARFAAARPASTATEAAA
jgi:acyl-CoA synthetase (AMP-forming)/AMP-acid ligase II